ncbi:MAG: ApaLI family restriction endonuclease [Endomicrobium sp.]|nr:ApaLI family restriction endonuclease [Endomicrobium sp.]
MFYYPNRSQAIKIQQTLETIYSGVGGSYYYGDNAWKYIEAKTQINLLGILSKIANNTTKG